MQDSQAVIAVAALRPRHVRLEADLVAKELPGAFAIPDEAVERRQQRCASRTIARSHLVTARELRYVDKSPYLQPLCRGRHDETFVAQPFELDHSRGALLAWPVGREGQPEVIPQLRWRHHAQG